jgi:hypothetical protein
VKRFVLILPYWSLFGSRWQILSLSCITIMSNTQVSAKPLSLAGHPLGVSVLIWCQLSLLEISPWVFRVQPSRQALVSSVCGCLSLLEFESRWPWMGGLSARIRIKKDIGGSWSPCYWVTSATGGKEVKRRTKESSSRTYGDFSGNWNPNRPRSRYTLTAWRL